MNVLVAEDDPDIQIILRMVLTRMGHCEVTLTDQGDKVVGLAKTSGPALILLDMMLPEMSGMEICQALKSDPETQAIPVIFLTARTQPSEMQEGLKLGAVGYLAKPFDPMTLIAQINDIVTPLGVHLGTCP
jgi:two-component system OmpR family response regulator